VADLFGSEIHMEATFSPCRRYRYKLSRSWGPGPHLAFLMLNPSTADESTNDPTVERCERRARRDGFGGVAVFNLFALRSTNPDALYSAKDPIGPNNDEHLLALDGFESVIAAWGTHGALYDRGTKVAAMLHSRGVVLAALSVNRDGSPKHPLYVANRTKAVRWSPPRG